MKWRFVTVDWLDAHSTAIWVAFEDLPEPTKITTRGWLVKEADDFIVVAGSYQHHDDEQVSEVIAVPRGCIISIEEI